MKLEAVTYGKHNSKIFLGKVPEETDIICLNSKYFEFCGWGRENPLPNDMDFPGDENTFMIFERVLHRDEIDVMTHFFIEDISNER